jgi:O-antigen/teichoic acid export membrane protein
MLKYSVPLIPNMLMWWLISALNRPMMESYLGLHSIGIYAMACKFPSVLSMIFAVFMSSWQISAIEEFGKDSYEAFFNRIFRIVMAGLFGLLCVFTLGSKILVSIFSTEAYFEAWKYIGLLSLACNVASISDFVGSTFTAIRKSKYFLYSTIWGALTAITMNFILIPRFGIMGAVISVNIAYVVMVVVRIRFGWKHVRITHIPQHLIMIILSLVLIIGLLYYE